MSPDVEPLIARVGTLLDELEISWASLHALPLSSQHHREVNVLRARLSVID